MVRTTLIFAVLLIANGLAGYLLSAVGSDAGPASVTALIPAFFGIALFLTGLVAAKPSLRKHAMHVAALIGLLGFIGSAMRLPKSWASLSSESGGMPLAFMSQSLMALLCLIFLIACIRSFVSARLLSK